MYSYFDSYCLLMLVFAVVMVVNLLCRFVIKLGLNHILCQNVI